MKHYEEIESIKKKHIEEISKKIEIIKTIETN